MAYNKKTWLARLGQGLNKFVLNGGSRVTLDSSPDVVTQQGTPLSADNMNDLEQRIADEFDEVNSAIAGLSSGIIFKGSIASSSLPTPSSSNVGWEYWLTDENTYAISDGTTWVRVNSLANTPDETDYAHALSNASTTQLVNGVKADLETEASEREATDSMLTARVENLEQKAGDYTTVQYRGTNAVPTGKASYGLVKNIVGKTRAWNQLCYNGNFENTDYWSGRDGDSISVSNNVLTVNTSSGSLKGLTNNASYIGAIAGHKYLLLGFIKSSVSGVADINLNSYNVGTSITAGNWTFVAKIVTRNTTSNTAVYFLVSGSFTSSDTIQYRDIIVRDLTLIFGSGNEPATVADALTALPALGQYNAYDAGSLVSTTVNGVESVGVNIWDEVWEQGGINSATGEDSSSTHYLRSKNMFKVLPSTTYYFKSGTSYGSSNMFKDVYYDCNGNFISANSDNIHSATAKSFTTPSNACYMRFQYGDYADVAVVNSYNHDIQICLNSYADKTTYHPYVHDTLSLPSVTLRSAGSVADEYTPETGVIVRKMVQVELSDYDWNYSGPYWSMASGTKKTNFINMVKAFGATVIPNWISGNLELATGVSVVQGIKTYAIGQSSDKGMLCNNGSDTTPPSGSLVVELATPTTESVSPTLDNTIYTEGGGTIDTVQTQSIKIDNCLDVGYLAV